MNMIQTPLHHRVLIAGGLALLALGAISIAITASRLQAQQDLTLEAQQAAEAERTASAVAKTFAEMREKSASSLARRKMRQDSSDRLGTSINEERSMLIQQYAKAKHDKHLESQNELRERLIELTRQEFQEIERKRKDEIQAIEDRLEKLKAVMQERAEKSELIIDLRVKRLLGEPTILDWNDQTALPDSSFSTSLGSLQVEDRIEAVEEILDVEPFDEAVESNKPLLYELEDANLDEATQDDVSLSVEQIMERMQDKEGQLGTLGVGMAGVYSMQQSVDKEWNDAIEQRMKLRAEIEVLESALRDLNKKGLNPSEVYEEYMEHRKELLAQHRAFEAQFKKLQAGRENWNRRIQQGEASLRKLKSEIDAFKSKLDQFRAKKKQEEDRIRN